MTSAVLIRLRTCSQVFLPKLGVMKHVTRFLRSDSGASAAEFAIVLPMFILMLFGIIVFGFYMAVVHGVQQLAAEAARSSVSGLSEAERTSLAQSYVSDNVRSYTLIDPSKVAVTASASPADANVFVVTVNYDASNTFIFSLRNLVPTPSPYIARSAAIPRGRLLMASKGLLGRFLADRRGNIATIAAVTFSLTLGAAAFGIDIGKLAADKRKLQSAADLAAIVAASNVSKAEAAARSTAQSNGFDAGAMKLVERGVYTPSVAVQAQKRFVPSNGADANAVRVSMGAQSELMFAKIFLIGRDRFDIQATATAATTGVATFAIGSRLVSLNGGLLNSILGATLGTNLSLSVMDYQALLDARVDAFDFLNALATKASVTGVTYNDVLAMNMKVGDVLSATQSSMTGSAAARTALGSIIQSVGTSSSTVVPSSILNAGPYGTLQVGQKPRTSVSLSAYDLVSATGRLADGTN